VAITHPCITLPLLITEVTVLAMPSVTFSVEDTTTVATDSSEGITVADITDSTTAYQYRDDTIGKSGVKKRGCVAATAGKHYLMPLICGVITLERS
jgi:hypothetical protein